jgi:hypothetical protein
MSQNGYLLLVVNNHTESVNSLPKQQPVVDETALDISKIEAEWRQLLVRLRDLRRCNQLGHCTCALLVLIIGLYQED